MAEKSFYIDLGKNKTHYAFLAAVLAIPAVLLVYFFAGRLPGEEHIFLSSDLRVLYVAFAKLFWRSLLSGEGIQYTFNVSLGLSSIPLYAGYSLSPFNILYLLIDHAELASIFLVVLKLALSAYTFQRFAAKVLKNDTLSSVAFSVAYALNGYNLIYYFNINFLDGVYMLPVIAMFITEAVKERRYAKLTLAYTYLFLTHFYEGYIIGFFSLLFFGLLMVTEYQKDWKKYVYTSVMFAISVGTAALIGAAFLYPTARFLLAGVSSTDNFYWNLNLNILDIYKNLFIGQYQTIASPYPYIYCGVMTLYLVPCFFADHRVKTKYKIMALILLGYLIVCSLWLPGYQFMHCFDVPDGFGFRFSYFYPFLLLAIGCAEWKYMDTKRPWKLILLFVIHIAGYFVAGIGEEKITMTDRVVSVVFILAFLGLFLLFRKFGERRLYKSVFLALVCVEIIINGSLIYGKVEMSDYRDGYQAFIYLTRQAVDEIKAYDQGFYRISQENPYDPNDSAMYDYYGILYFSSVEDIRQRKTLNALGYAAAARGVHDNGGTSLTKMLFAQKYEIIVNDADYIYGRTDSLWTVNDKTLSLGYMVSDTILSTMLDSDNAFENQNNIAMGMTGQEIRVFIPYEGEVTGTAENLSVFWNGANYIMERENGMSEGSLIFRFEDNTQLPAYAYFSQEQSYYMTEAYYFASREDDRLRLRQTAVISLPQIIELARDDEGKYFIGIYFDKYHTNKNYYKAAYFYCLDEDALGRVYDQLKDHQMNILEMKGSDITAEIDVPSDKTILFTSIPYDEGWHVYVNGEEAKTIAVVNDTFLAIELPEGHHELKFHYSSNVNRTGMILTIAGITLYFGIIIEDKNKSVKIQKNTQN